MPTPSASGASQRYGEAASGGGNPGSWTQSLRQPTSGGSSGRPGGDTSAPVLDTDDDFETWDWETEIQPLRSSPPSSGSQSAADPGPAAGTGSHHSPSIYDFQNLMLQSRPVRASRQSSGPQSAADPGPAASAGSGHSPSIWRSSISPQQRYSQADTLDAHEAAVRDPDDAYHSEFWEQGVCSGVAATWMVDRVLHPNSSSADRISRLSSEQGLRATLSTHQKGHSAHLLGSLGFLGGSAMNGERASMLAMLEPGRMVLDGEPSEFRLSRGDATSIASTISTPGHSMINIPEIQSRQDPSFIAGHMLSAYSDGSRIEIFDGNRGEFHADVSEAGTLLKDVLGYYSGAYEMDKVVVHRLAPR